MMKRLTQIVHKYWQMTLCPGFVTVFDPDNYRGTPIKAIAFRKDTQNWQAIFEQPELEELVIHSPNREQLAALARLPQLKRLHLILARVKDIAFLGELGQLEELALTLVSGFSDLSPLAKLTHLRSLYIEYLRGVTDFSALAGLTGLRFLSIDGSLDAKQSIDSFDFLAGLSALEVFCAHHVSCKAPYPMFAAALQLENLQEVHLGRSAFPLEEYAFWEIHFPDVPGSRHELAMKLDGSDNLYFLGKGSGRVSKGSKNAEPKIAEFERKYQAIKAKVLEGYK